MIEWSEQHRMIRDAVRRFVDAEVVPESSKRSSTATCRPTTSCAS